MDALVVGSAGMLGVLEGGVPRAGRSRARFAPGSAVGTVTAAREGAVMAPLPSAEVAIVSATDSGGRSCCPRSRLTRATSGSGFSSTESMTALCMGAVAASLLEGEPLVVDPKASGLVAVADG